MTTESIQRCGGGATCVEEPRRSSPALDFWRFAAEQYGLWLDDDQWLELAELDDHVLIARRFFWRLSDPEIHELLSALPASSG